MSVRFARVSGWSRFWRRVRNAWRGARDAFAGSLDTPVEILGGASGPETSIRIHGQQVACRRATLHLAANELNYLVLELYPAAHVRCDADVRYVMDHPGGAGLLLDVERIYFRNGAEWEPPSRAAEVEP